MINKLIKKLFAIIAVLAIALTMALNLNFSAKNNNLSDISLQNTEALAQAEIWEKVFDIYYSDPGVPGCWGCGGYQIVYCVEGGDDWCF